MKSPVVKRSIVVAGHKTSVSLEEAFWSGMKEISGQRDMTLSELVGRSTESPARQSVVRHSPLRAGLFSHPRRGRRIRPSRKPSGLALVRMGRGREKPLRSSVAERELRL